MMKRLLGPLLALCLATSAHAQQYMTLPPGTLMGNVTSQTNPGNAVTLPQLITALGSLGVITSQSMSGDCTMALSGVITCIPPISHITGLGTGVATWLGTPSGANLLAALTTSTGTGLPVFGTAPNITSPTGIVKGDVGLGNVPNVDTTNATNLSSGSVPAARMPALTGDCTTSAGAVATTCTKTNNVAFTAAATAANGQLPGTATNDSATAGNVGELLSSTVLSAAAVTLTTGTPANMTSLSLTAGDWDVWCSIWLLPGGSTTSTLQQAWVSTVSATAPTVPATNVALFQLWQNMPAGGGSNMPTGMATMSLSSTTTAFCGTFITFAVSTMKAYGTLWARRRR